MAIRDIILETRARAELEKSQWLPRKKLEALQIHRLRAFLKNAYETVPYYHRMLDEVNVRPEDIHSIQDLSKLPILKKEEVRNRIQELMSSKYAPRELSQRRTSGSTSIPLTVYMNREQVSYHRACKLRNLKWLGIGEGELSVYMGSPGIEIYPRNIPEDLQMTSFEISPDRLDKLTRVIRQLKPRHVWGFPSGLNLLTRFCEEHSIDDIHFTTIQTTGESLFSNEKEKMQKAFGSDIYQFYATTEARMIGADCSEHSGLHICSETIVVEFLKDGEPAAEGELASVVVTPLFGYGMPLIRYDLEDAASRIEDNCPCGRSLPLMSYVDGRIMDILVTGDGRWLGYSNFRSRIFDHVDVLQYRVIQENPNNITIELIPGNKYGEKSESFIVSSMKKYMGSDTTIHIRVVKTIDAQSTMKRRTVISKVPLRWKPRDDLDHQHRQTLG